MPTAESFHFPAGLADFLKALTEGRELVADQPFTGEAALEDGAKVEWAVAWPVDEEAYAGYYCNTVPTALGGTHEAGLRTALLKGLRAHAERIGFKKAGVLTAEDVQGGACALLSLFMRQPQFQGQTKERLVSPEAARLVEAGVRDRFDLWLGSHPTVANAILNHVTTRAEDRLARKKAKEEVGRKTATRKLRLPGKLADCAREARDGTEIFIVEGDSAGGSAKQARNRETQAILPLRGKILNVASAAADQLEANKELQDLVTALGCGAGKHYRGDELRYEKVVIMTDADVDGAHIAALLMTFFYPPAAEADRARQPLSGPAAALPPGPWRHHRLRPRRGRPGAPDRHRLQGQEEHRDRPLQGPGRDERPSAQGDHHGPRPPPAAPGAGGGPGGQARGPAGRGADGPPSGTATGVHPAECSVREGGAGCVASRLHVA